MPTYAYACKDCVHAFDIQQSFSDDSLTVCPECSGTLRKKFNSVGVVFKGSGFYRNDSRETKSSSEAGVAPAPSTSAEPKGAGKDSTAPGPAKGNGTKAPAPAAAGSNTKASVSAGQTAS